MFPFSALLFLSLHFAVCSKLCSENQFWVILAFLTLSVITSTASSRESLRLHNSWRPVATVRSSQQGFPNMCDAIDYQVLLKLNAYAIDGAVLAWLKSFVCGQSFRVKMGMPFLRFILCSVEDRRIAFWGPSVSVLCKWPSGELAKLPQALCWWCENI